MHCAVNRTQPCDVIPLQKGGDLNDPSNYRGIAMSSCLSKLFCKILDSRLQAYLEEYDIINRCQIGFRPKSRTSDHILVLTSINIYIFIAIALHESIFLDVLHFPMKNIKSRDLEATHMGGATSMSASDVVCLLLLL